MIRKYPLFAAAATCALLTQPAQADEGMWTPAQVPVIAEQMQAARSKGKGDLAELLAKGQTWTVSGTAQDPI